MSHRATEGDVCCLPHARGNVVFSATALDLPLSDGGDKRDAGLLVYQLLEFCVSYYFSSWFSVLFPTPTPTPTLVRPPGLGTSAVVFYSGSPRI